MALEVDLVFIEHSKLVLSEKWICWASEPSLELVSAWHRPVGSFLMHQVGDLCHIQTPLTTGLELLLSILYSVGTSECSAFGYSALHLESYVLQINLFVKSVLLGRLYWRIKNFWIQNFDRSIAVLSRIPCIASLDLSEPFSVFGHCTSSLKR